MKAIYVSDELHRRAKQWAAKIGLPLKEVIERWIAQGIHEIPTEAPVSLRETALTYEVLAPIEMVPPAFPAQPTAPKTPPADLERSGVLVRGEQLREQFQAEYLALRRILGITSPPDLEPPSVDEVRAIFRRQRELYPDAPTVGEIIRQMREEE